MGTIIAIFISLATLTFSPINTVAVSGSPYIEHPVNNGTGDNTTTAPCNVGGADVDGM